MSHVSIPEDLRPLTGGANSVVVPGSTIGEMLDSLEARFPGIGKLRIRCRLNLRLLSARLVVAWGKEPTPYPGLSAMTTRSFSSAPCLAKTPAPIDHPDF